MGVDCQHHYHAPPRLAPPLLGQNGEGVQERGGVHCGGGGGHGKCRYLPSPLVGTTKGKPPPPIIDKFPPWPPQIPDLGPTSAGEVVPPRVGFAVSHIFSPVSYCLCQFVFFSGLALKILVVFGAFFL